MYRLCKNILTDSIISGKSLLNNSYSLCYWRRINHNSSIIYGTSRRFSSGLNENNNHESSKKQDSLLDLLVELNYSGKKKYSPSYKLRLLYNIINNDKNYEVTYSSHVSNIILDLWKSRGMLNNSELPLFDKICYELSEKIWNVMPNRTNTLPDRLYYSQFKYDLRKLNDEILNPTVEQYQKKQNLIDHLKPIFQSTIDGKLYTFGSCDNGLWSRGSDIDLCLVVPNCDSKRYMLSKLNLIKSCLSTSDIISKISIISARVPIVKLYDMDNNNLCDISINNTVALLNSEYVKTMCNIDSRVITMGRFIKYWATCRKINNRAEGTMSSYTLILQLFYYLQNRNPPIIPTLKEIELDQRNGDDIESNDSEQNHHSEDVQPSYDNVNHIISQEYNYLTDPTEIRSKCDYLNKNEEDVIDLLFGYFEFYSQPMFAGGMTCSTIDMYNNEVTENENGSLIVKCPLSKKNVNPFTIRMWQSIYSEFKRANDLIKLKQPISTICQEMHLSPLELQMQQHQINQQKLLRLFK
ncbi:hypothetical protein MACJ_002321 [Theileria orientalis]|uniref:Poly(A) RNA polymerase mitochondrial-like central palm domain-containing protein n=1 Tax=Theileria orientalis TaxID=68886 RepID=A0A976QVE9_THEOR|nr:hypothetical protein MACJ_002321 [Theileria orientalis]